jgi:ATP-binding cassette, subfamily B, multidrug efflux pump
VKYYNPRVMRRLLGYLSPYKLTTLAAILGLIGATVCELLLPVIIQQTVDLHIVAEYVEVDEETAAELENREIATRRLDESIYVLESAVSTVTAGNVFRPTEDQTRYYVVTQGSETLAISKSAFEELSPEERGDLRREDIAGINRNALGFLGLLFGILVFTFVQVYLLAYLGQRLMRDLRTQLFTHTINQSMAYLNQNPVGKLVTRSTNDVETINELFTNVIGNLLKNFAIMVGVIITFFLMNPRLGILATATLPPVLLVTIVFRRRARDAFRAVRHRVSRLNAFLAEHLAGVAVVQMFVQEKRTNREFEEQNDELMKANLGEMYVFATFRPLIDLLSSVSIAFVIYYGGAFVLRGVVSLGVLIAFLNLIRQFYRQLLDISERFVVLQSAMVGSERVFALLDEVDRIPDAGGERLTEPIRGEVRFEGVTFSYREDDPVLTNLSLTVQPGQRVALVGYTGAGKTTIANLLTRFWDIQEGRILLDGKDIRTLPLGDLRRAVQPIQQDVFLFRGTVGENIRLGEELSDEEIWRALRVVHADGFVRELPEGLETHLAEGAQNISVGQRQLLSFARAVAHDPPIIILDEATSSVDTETEQRIQEALEAVLENRTSLVIAHRLSTIQHADRIVVLSQGQIVEEGNHQELLKNEGLYAQLYRLQYVGPYSETFHRDDPLS